MVGVEMSMRGGLMGRTPCSYVNRQDNLLGRSVNIVNLKIRLLEDI